MSVHKVPQDVEADDKLLGPFSFRQFIYLVVAILGIAAAWGLSRILLPLFIIPLPLVLFFGALALPLRKDQPMETYLAAMVSFYLKPRRRLWDPDGTVSLIQIAAPPPDEVTRVKDLSQAEAARRFSYLADIVDTQGWSVRGVDAPVNGSAMTNDALLEAQGTQDILDQSAPVGQSFDHLIEATDARHKQAMLARMQQQMAAAQTQPQAAPAVPTASIQPPTPVNPYDTFLAAQPAQQPAPLQAPAPGQLVYNPYPAAIHQNVLQPLGAQPQGQAPVPAQAAPQQPVPAIPQPTPSAPAISPDIINLASNSDLSIETIAREANRIEKKTQESLPDDEVVISLR